ncbi:MAG: TonB-dependent receptor [Bacteroidales bacterium]|nr:TonB-dependent receptor [Bacteroidales bacterium]
MGRFLVITLLFLGFQANAQFNGDSLQINYACENKYLKHVLSEISNEYPVHFSYSSTLINTDESITLNAVNLYLHDFLDTLLPKTIGYEIFYNQIALFPVEREKQSYYFSGFVYDQQNNESLIGVTIYNPELNRGIVTNVFGYYSIKLPEGKYKFIYNYLGFLSDTVHINLNRNIRKNIHLKESSIRLNEITVTNATNYESIYKMRLNQQGTKLQIHKLQKIPNLFGEGDIVQNITSQPGITSVGLSNDNLHIRGGNSSQNLFIIDDAPVYDISHLGGFFSVINPDVVKYVHIYKNNIPAMHGDALSSIIDVRLREGSKKEWKLRGNTGIISSRIAIEGPLQKDKTSMVCAFRRTYIDQVLQLFPKENEYSYPNFYFYDFNLKVNSILNNQNVIFFSAYAGDDYYKQLEEVQRQNQLVSLRWNHVFNKSLFVNITALGSRKKLEINGNPLINLDYRWINEAYVSSLKADFNYSTLEKWKINFGGAAEYQRYSPYKINPGDDDSPINKGTATREDLMKYNLYAGILNTSIKNVSMEISTRANYFRDLNTGSKVQSQTTSPLPPVDIYSRYQKYIAIEPRLSIRHEITDKISWNGGYYKLTQYTHKILMFNPGLSIDRRFNANELFPPESSHNFIWGLQMLPFKNMLLSCELYYRKIHHILNFYGNIDILNLNDYQNYFSSDNSLAKGIEFTIEGKRGIFNYNFNYTLSKALLKTENYNNNEYYPASFDRPHAIALNTNFKFKKRLLVNLQWNFLSGTPYTPIISKYIVDNTAVYQIDETQVNMNRLPPYHRLDLSLDIASKKNPHRRWKSFWNISIYNCYFRKNPLGIIYGYELDEDNEFNNSSPIKLQYYYFYQFVPSISYRFVF